jgi:hypothetical protein
MTRPRRVSIRPVRRPLALIAPLLTAWRQARTDAGVGGRTSKIDIRSEEGYFYEGKGWLAAYPTARLPSWDSVGV